MFVFCEMTQFSTAPGNFFCFFFVRALCVVSIHLQMLCEINPAHSCGLGPYSLFAE